MSSLKRSRSDPPPPITVEDTATERAKTFDVRPTYHREESTPDVRQRRNAAFGHRRTHSPNLQWHEEWTEKSWTHGRVLLIDYVGKDHAPEGRRKVVSQEFCDVDSLRRFYRKKDLAQQAALRVIHVQNAPWATRFLLGKFNIDGGHDLVGRFVFSEILGEVRKIKRGTKMMELNGYDADEMPHYAYDALVQRLSVYVQLSTSTPGSATDPDMPNPYNEEEFEDYQRLKKSYGDVNANEHREKYIPKLNTLDNGSTIIVFESSQSGDVKDTLIGARQEIESRWRRLTFYLSRAEASSDETLAIECMDYVLKDIFQGLAYNWTRFLAACETHVGILEDKIYDNPADESRDQELWSNSALWNKVERLIWKHRDMVDDMRNYLHELASGGPKEDEEWLGDTPSQLERLTNQCERDIINPTKDLAELMYKSVGIRDARHSLQLGLSMWRLSWITFIFLPLTFMCGFFGMNVDTFEGNPSIKWFFITSIPVLATVLILWYGVKHSLSTQRQNPLRRGVYEALYHDLATDYPHLWTRRGPRDNITMVGAFALIKWRLVRRWFGSEKLQKRGEYNPAIDEFGTWSRIKQFLVRKWLPQLQILVAQTLPQTNKPDDMLNDEQLEEVAVVAKDLGAIGELMSIATPVALAEIEPTAASRLQRRIPQERLKSLSPTRSDGSGRPSSDGGMSGVMVDERGVSEEERSGDERNGDEELERERARQRERLHVPS
ncbi:Guanine nucleotide exchange factor lte1 [Didymella heteroderae]|uniref:Guanine nucleotide exchange factor lte1 n=1 Tax=Didymella heteroderae TaxID=1769908 RepID=A0A9P5C5E0_9PLEO|nr:Guanine nucleotide exchange factor lte1 [Didymella heteroderae]